MEIVNCSPINKENVPDWAKEAIWYQIFVERFWNGDKNNDPTLEDTKGGWPFILVEKWQIHPWTSDWYELQPWEEGRGRDFYWNAGLRRYGGDLQGILDRLDYLQNLGINAIYFNPLFEAPSHHKYDATMYHHIENNFGPNPVKDSKIWESENPADPTTWRWTTADSLFIQLLKACHQRNIRVIIDGVFNHVGLTFWAFQDVKEKQMNSIFRDWFIINRWDDPATPEDEFDYEGWSGIKDLPEFREDENGIVEGPRQHIKAIVERWMDPDGDGDPSDGIDGWRLDVAEKVNINFWRDFRKWVKEINPDAYITGEIWWEDWRKNKMFNAAPWLQGDVFDAVMNYRWGRAAKQFVVDVKNKITPSAFSDSIQKVFQEYPRENVYVLMNMVGSHDMERLPSQAVNPDRWSDHGGNPAQDKNFDVRKPDDQERLKQKLVVGMQMTCPGAPLIYYGDEAGMWGGDDPDCRKPMIWPEIVYDPEVSHPFGKKRPVDQVTFDRELFNWYKKLIQIRQENKALSLGSISFLLKENSYGVLGYLREYQNQKILVLVNSSSENQIIALQSNQLGLQSPKLIDLISEKMFEFSAGDLSLPLKPFQILLLKEIRKS